MIVILILVLLLIILLSNKSNYMNYPDTSLGIVSQIPLNLTPGSTDDIYYTYIKFTYFGQGTSYLTYPLLYLIEAPAGSTIINSLIVPDPSITPPTFTQPAAVPATSLSVTGSNYAKPSIRNLTNSTTGTMYNSNLKPNLINDINSMYSGQSSNWISSDANFPITFWDSTYTTRLTSGNIGTRSVANSTVYCKIKCNTQLLNGPFSFNKKYYLGYAFQTNTTISNVNWSSNAFKLSSWDPEGMYVSGTNLKYSYGNFKYILLEATLDSTKNDYPAVNNYILGSNIDPVTNIPTQFEICTR